MIKTNLHSTSSIFWYVTKLSLGVSYRRFGTCRLHLQWSHLQRGRSLKSRNLGLSKNKQTNTHTHTNRRVYIIFTGRYSYMFRLIVYLSSGCTRKQIRNNIAALNFLLIFLCVQPKHVAVLLYSLSSCVQ